MPARIIGTSDFRTAFTQPTSLIISTEKFTAAHLVKKFPFHIPRWTNFGHLPSCSAVPQPAAPPRAPYTLYTATKFSKTLSGQKPCQVAERRVTRTRRSSKLWFNLRSSTWRLLARGSSIENLSHLPFPVWSRLDGRTNPAATEEYIIELHRGMAI
jgi:hypothetical protein